MAGVIKAVGWAESERELYEIYRAQEDVGLRKRAQAMWLLRSGVTETEAARLAGVGRRTLTRWLGWYREGGLEEVNRRVPGHGAPGGTARLTSEQMGQLRERAATGAFRTYEDARLWVLEAFGVEYGYHGMYSVLARMDVHPKVPRPIAAKADPEAQEAWKKGGSA